MKRIASQENPTFRALLRLSRSRRFQQERGKLLLEGAHLLQAYTSAFGFDGIQIVLRASDAHEEARVAWAHRCVHTAPLLLSDTLFDRISTVASSAGILAVADRPDGSGPTAARSGGFGVLLDRVQDPGNLGSIMRSAAAAGARAVFLSPDCADPWSAKALRGGMGGQFLLEIHENQDLPERARLWGGCVLAADRSAESSLYEAELPPNTAFIFGSEGQGLRPEVRACANGCIAIPVAPSIESLNVAAAAAVCFFEWRRRRGPAWSRGR